IDPARDRVQPASYRLEVVRELPLQNLVRLNKDQYAPGDKVIGEVFAPAAPAKQGKIDGQPVQIHSEPRFAAPAPPPSVPNGGGPNVSGPKAKGGLAAPVAPNYKIETMVPKSVSPGAMVPFVIPMQDGKREIRANIPIAPTDFTIDFFPEGGE